MKLRHLLYTALLGALLCLLCPISIPIGTVPLSLATFGIYLVTSLANKKTAIFSLAIYLGLGALGLPVFAGFLGGVGTLCGPTGGFLMGYLAIAALGAGGKPATSLLRTMLGTLVCYALGLAWFMWITGSSFWSAFSICILPFLLADGIKLAGAHALGATLRPRLEAIGVILTKESTK